MAAKGGRVSLKVEFSSVVLIFILITFLISALRL